MNIGKAVTVFNNINNQNLTDLERGEAIKVVIDMPTHNSISKRAMLEVIRYLVDVQCGAKMDEGSEVE